MNIVATRCQSDFNDKMYQNRFWLGLHPRSKWESLQHSPRSPSWNKRDLLLREGLHRGKGEEGRDERGNDGEGREREKSRFSNAL